MAEQALPDGQDAGVLEQANHIDATMPLMKPLQAQALMVLCLWYTHVLYSKMLCITEALTM